MGTPAERRRALAIALAAYSVVLAVVLLAPTSSHQSEAASWLGDVGSWFGVPERFRTQSRVEFVCNALILMPVELTQGLVLPHRTVATADVVANTLGGSGGALAVAAWWRLRRRPAA